HSLNNILVFISSLERQHSSTILFPYTTLFRSSVPAVAPRNVLRLIMGFPPGRQLVVGRWPVEAGATFVAVAGFFVETAPDVQIRSEEHTSELQSREKIVCRLLLEKNKIDSSRG